MIPKLLALLLTLVMVCTPSVLNVIAAFEDIETSNPAKNDGKPQASQTPAVTESASLTNGGDSYTGKTDPNCTVGEVPGFIIKLVKIPNTAKDSQECQDYIATRNEGKDVSDWITECQLSAIDYALYTFPKELYGNPDIANDVLLLSRYANYKTTAFSDFHYVTADGYRSQDQFTHVYDVKGALMETDGHWFPGNAVFSDVCSDPALLNRFLAGELTYNDLIPYMPAEGSSEWQEVEKYIIELFKDTGLLKTELNDIWYYIKTDTAGGDQLGIYRVAYLDLLLAINHMAGGRYIDLINVYLSNLNSNGCNDFIVPMFAAAIVYRPYNEKTITMVQTLPDFYGYYKGVGADDVTSISTINPVLKSYQQITESSTGESAVDYRSNHMSHWFSKLEGLSKATAAIDGLKRTNMIKGVWWSPSLCDREGIAESELAFSLFPTDCFGRATGWIGYTYLALGGGPSSIEPALPFKLTAQSSQTEVEPGSKVAATLNIDLKQTNTSVVQNAFTENGEKAMLTIQYGVQAVEGSGVTSVIDNIQTAPSGASKSGDVLTINDIALKDIMPYINGSKMIQINDVDITISQKTTNKYTAIVTLSWSNGKKLQFEAAGKTIESQYQASDKVSWLTTEPDPDTWHFYSTIGKNGSTGQDNYVEIKEGSPGNESFEAMAGVPTTEDLYVGFGATEFMVNMDVELDTSKGMRNYYYLYNAANCIGNDEPCEYSCPGHKVDTYVDGCGALTCTNTSSSHTHSDSCYCKKGSEQSGECSSGKITLTSKCDCGAKEDKQVFTPKWGNGYSRCLGGDGSKDYTGMGCVHTEHTNSTHRGVIFQGCIQQPIASFNYMNITALDLWRVNKLELKGNNKLLSNSNQSWDPNTGYHAFFNQNGYLSGNGRLIFVTNMEKQNINNCEIWGDTTYECPNPSKGYITWDAACSLASKWMNECAANTKVSAVVVSDYLSLCTTEGYQTLSFHSYDSDIVQLTNESFTTVGFVDNVHGTALSPIKGNTITFSNVKTGTDLWVNNSNTAFKWDSDHITRSGYNGDYSSPSTKWNNSNVTSNKTLLVAGNKNNIRSTEESIEWFNALAKIVGKDFHPNSKNREGDKSFVKGFSNLRTTYTGLNIIDSTDTDTKDWSDSDSLQPVYNGEWDTGKCYLYAKKEISFGSTKGGINYSTESDGSYKQEVGYTAGKTKVNNIVVHNPVSVQNATVICNDSEYDLRSTASLAEGGDPVSTTTGCPNSAACQYQTLVCTELPSPHTDACYTEVSVVTEHVGGMNAHVHVSGQSSQSVEHKHDTTCYNTCGGALESYTVYHKTDCPNLGSIEKKDDCTEDCKLVSGAQKDYGLMKATLVYKCNLCEETYTTISGACNKKILVCTKTTDQINNSCTHTHTKADCYETKETTYKYSHNTTNCKWHEDSDGDGDAIYDCNTDDLDDDGYHTGKKKEEVLVCTKSTTPGEYCTHILNKHECTSECHTTTQKVLICTNPHHYNPGENPPEVKNGQIVSALYHYDYGDTRCWQPCGDDNKHKDVPEVKLGDGSTVSTNNLFINLDREFWIYVPDVGDFAQQPSLHGILETTDIRGMGYTDNMDCDKWTRDKYAIFPFAVATEDGYTYEAYKPINLYYLTSHYYTINGKRDDGYYKFYCLLANNEAMNANVEFLSIASNAEERYCNESIDVTNKERIDFSHKARHTASKTQYVDVLGYIGSLTLNDTGDFRFATLFKKQKNNNKWLIENLVPEVHLNLPNKILSDPLDVRQEVASPDTNWHCTFGNTYTSTGGKAYEHSLLPLTPTDNPIKALQEQPLRPGYKLYMDVETVGNYYGENRNSKGVLQDSELYYKMQITPRYWALDLSTKQYYPVDVYMGQSSNYTPVVKFSTDASEASEYLYYLDWFNESSRRNYTAKEKEATILGVQYLTGKTGSVDNPSRSPNTLKDVIGTAARLFLNDLNRTFIGSSKTYGKAVDKWNIIDENQYRIQSQRWHFTLGLPSSSVFVKAGKPCTDANIKEIAEMNAVIICALNIKVKGTVWTLEYDGTAINNSDGSGFQIVPGGEIYSPPIDPETGKILTDPIVVVYSNKMTSADDLRTEGSH